MIGSKIHNYQYATTNSDRFVCEPNQSTSFQSQHRILDEIIPSTFGSARNCEKCECFVPQRSQTIEEFKSVQSLKQFWINAFGGTNNHKPQSGKCLSKNCSLKREKSATLNGTVTRRTKVNEIKEKSLSLNRNFQLSEDLSGHSVSTQPVLQKRLSDNFYKYKTADLVKSHKFCDRSYSLDIIKSTDNLSEATTNVYSDFFSCENVHSIGSDNQLKICSKHSTVDDNNLEILVPTTAIDKSQDFNECTTMREIETDKNKQRDKMTITTKLSATTSDKIPLSPCCSKSTNSSTNSLSSDSPRKTNNQTRKCSFRTNSFQFHRKMTSNGGGSTVAALTHRFNRMIQSDADILEEVKRNKKVIIHRTGGHVFKIKEGGEVTVKKKSVRKVDSAENASPQKTIKKKASVKRKGSIKAHPVSVKDAIQLFEPSVGTIEESTQSAKREKPKVPDKSPQVLLRTKEIVIRKNLLNKPSTVLSNHTTDSDIDKRVLLDEIKESNEDKNVAKKLKETIDSIDNQDSTVPPINYSIQNLVEDSIYRSDSIIDHNGDETQDKHKKVYKRLYAKFRMKGPSVNTKRLESFNVPTTQDFNNEVVNSVNQAQDININRLEVFSRSEHCLSWEDEKNYQKMARHMKPNKSFLFSNPPSDETTKVVEAINPFVLNKTRSMDETRFRSTCLMTQVSLDERGFEHIFQETDDLLSLVKDSLKNEDDYEVIKHPDDQEVHINGNNREHGSCSEQPTASFIRCESKRINYPLNNVTEEVHDSSSIYQSISEARSNNQKDIDCDSVTSYESFENYESVDELLMEKIKQENGYEICNPPDPPPPRKNETSNDYSTTIPALPVPKRNLNNFNDLQKSDSSSSNYEKIKYDKAPPRPPKSPCLYKSDDRLISSNVSDSNEHDYEENIYDTIKIMDGNSVTGYESINSTNGFLRISRTLKHSDSGSTMSSEQKTNSLYGTVAGRQSITPPSEGGSENSDEWMDISDGEDDRKHKFVV